MPGFEPTVIGLDNIVRVSLEHVPRLRCELLDHSRVDRSPVGRDLHRHRAPRQCSGEEGTSGAGIAAFGEQHIDDLAVLIDGSI
jgi:hypothetical protein